MSLLLLLLLASLVLTLTVQANSEGLLFQDNVHLIIDHANTIKPNIREAVANEQSIEGLVAPQVAKYIAEQFLYKESEKEIECSHIALQS